MITLARRNAEINGVQHKVRFVLSDYEALNFVESFDCAIFFDSLHHADAPGLAIECAFRALKSGGVLITHEPGEGHSSAPWSLQAMKEFGVNEHDMPPYLITQLARDAGFRETQVFPMQHAIHEIFYTKHQARPFSRKGLALIRRLYAMAFQPNLKVGSIMVMTK